MSLSRMSARGLAVSQSECCLPCSHASQDLDHTLDMLIDAAARYERRQLGPAGMSAWEVGQSLALSRGNVNLGLVKPGNQSRDLLDLEVFPNGFRISLVRRLVRVEVSDAFHLARPRRLRCNPLVERKCSLGGWCPRRFPDEAWHVPLQ